MTGPEAQPAAVALPPADRVYLGWEYAQVHPDPGPPPPRPALPGPVRLNPGWLTAQQREERRLAGRCGWAAGWAWDWPG